MRPQARQRELKRLAKRDTVFIFIFGIFTFGASAGKLGVRNYDQDRERSPGDPAECRRLILLAMQIRSRPIMLDSRRVEAESAAESLAECSRTWPEEAVKAARIINRKL
jgi:hypothetical protein